MSATEPTLEIDDSLYEELQRYRSNGQLVEVKPFKDSDSDMRDNVEMYRSFHNRTHWHGINTSPINSFEMWYDGNAVRFFMFIGDDSKLRRSVNHVVSNFPGARVIRPEEADEGGLDFPLAFRNSAQGPELANQHVCGARFHLSKHFYAPIRNPDGVEEFIEPYRNIIEDMVEESGVRTVFQVLFRPAGTGWTSSAFSDARSYAESLAESGTAKMYTEQGVKEETVGAPSEAKSAMRNIKSQVGQPGYYINVRVISIGQTRDKAVEELGDVCQTISQYYREWTGQTLVPITETGEDIRYLLADAIGRRGRRMDWPQNPLTLWRRQNRGTCETLIMTKEELAALAHFPTGETVPSGAIDWEVLDTTNTLPPTAPKYEEHRRAPNQEPNPTDSDEQGGESIE